MASGENKKTGSLAEGGKKTIKYGLIGFHGVVNEVAAKHTNLTERDVALLLKGMWNGTKELLTTSKKGHMPRLLIKVNYNSGFFIGDLLELIKPNNKNNTNGHQIEDEQIESISDYILNTKALNEVLKKHKDKIISIQVKKDDRLELSEEIFNSSELNIE
jgi:CRISPR-associated protein Csh2